MDATPSRRRWFRRHFTIGSLLAIHFGFAAGFALWSRSLGLLDQSEPWDSDWYFPLIFLCGFASGVVGPRQIRWSAVAFYVGQLLGIFLLVRREGGGPLLPVGLLMLTVIITPMNYAAAFFGRKARELMHDGGRQINQ